MAETSAPAEINQWDFDKARTLAALLVDDQSIEDAIDKSHAKSSRLREDRRTLFASAKSSRQALELEELGPTLSSLRLDSIAQKLSLKQTEVSIALIVNRKELTSDIDQIVEEKLKDYALLYDTDPERFSQMTTEEFAEEAAKVDALKEAVEIASKARRDLNDLDHRTKHDEERLNDEVSPSLKGNERGYRIDWALISTFYDRLESSVERIFGKDSEQIAQLRTDYETLVASSYDKYTPKQLVEECVALNYKWIGIVDNKKAALQAELDKTLGLVIETKENEEA